MSLRQSTLEAKIAEKIAALLEHYKKAEIAQLDTEPILSELGQVLDQHLEYRRLVKNAK